MSKSRHITVPYNKFDLTKFTTTELKEVERVPNQELAYCNYTDEHGTSQCDIQTPELKLDNFGIPSSDHPNYNELNKRNFLKQPLKVFKGTKNETEEEQEVRNKYLNNFVSLLTEIDEYMQTKETQLKLFGSEKKAKKYRYQPIVRESKVVQDSDSDSDSDDEEEKEKVVVVEKPPFMKIKIPLDFDVEGQINPIDIYKPNEKGTDEYEEDGKYSLLESVTDLDQLRNYVSYMKNYKMVIHISYVWASKKPALGQDTRMYGITFKLQRVVMLSPVRTNQVIEDTGDKFIESDDEEEDQQVIKAKHFVEVDEEEEKEVEKPKPKKGRKKKSQALDV